MVDVYDRPDAIVVRSLIAGVSPEDLEISLHEDMLTLRGERKEYEEIADDQFYARECYWGSFSRTIIIPAQVQQDKIKAFAKPASGSFRQRSIIFLSRNLKLKSSR